MSDKDTTVDDRMKEALRELRWNSSNPYWTEPKKLMEHHVEQFARQLVPRLSEIIGDGK